MDHICRNCKWWQVNDNGKEGTCHRHAPSDASPRAKWPVTQYYQWCAQHSSIEGKERNYILQSIADALWKLYNYFTMEHTISLEVTPSVEDGEEE